MPSFRRVFRDALLQFRESVPEKQLEFYLKLGDLQSALSVFQFTNKFETPLRDAFEELLVPLAERAAEYAAEDTAKLLSEREKADNPYTQYRARLKLRKEAAREWARTFAAEEVYRISERMRRAMRMEIERAFRYMRNNQVNVTTLARRIKNLGIGLTGRLQQAVYNRETALLEAGLPRYIVDRMVKRYHSQLVNYRANMIAQTEVMTAVNMGQQMVWWQAIDNGIISGSSKRVWLTTSGRPCPICASLDGEVVGMNQDFKTIVSSVVYTTLTPPIHPHCQCILTLQL